MPKIVDLLRSKGIKAGLLRPVTLFPFPKKVIGELAPNVKGFLSVEMNAGQMSEDIKLALFEAGYIRRVEYFGRMGGIIPNPNEVAEAMRSFFVKEDV